jgi:acetyl esterase/lipase
MTNTAIDSTRDDLPGAGAGTGPDRGAALAEQRAFYETVLASTPLPAGSTRTPGTLGGVPVVFTGEPDPGPDAPVLLYLHGGAYVLGSAMGGAGLAAQLAVRAGARAVSVDYRLAPEHPYPAAPQDALAAYRALLDEGVPASRIAFAGDSAGGGLAVTVLVAAREAGLPMPAAAVVLSPWYDLALSGASVAGKAADDPVLTEGVLREAAADYLGAAGAGPDTDDLRGLPPLLVQAGSYEILLDDAVRLAGRAAAADVPVELQVYAGLTHVFQLRAGSGQAAEADEAVDRAGGFLRRALAARAPLAAG